MRTALLQPLGVQVTDLSLATVDSITVTAIRSLLARYGVVVMPDQHVDDATFVAFLASFGPLVFTTGETHVPDYPDLNVVSNVGRTTAPTSSFHVDTSYVASPPAYTALRAVQIPERGGETLFTDQYKAHDTLPADTRADLVGRTIRHIVTGVELGPDDESEADHPVLRQHPVSGRTSLYLTTPKRCAAISGMDEERAHRTVEYLFAHSTRAENTLRHAWSAGDIVMWDNGCVLHRADHGDVTGDRVMHRGMVAGVATAGLAATAAAGGAAG